MYSVVLMAALTTGSDAVDFGRRGRGCCGCYGGGYYAGCYGGYGRWGCYGGMGCYGGGYGGWGCYGGCYGGMGCYGGWGGMGYRGYGYFAGGYSPYMVASYAPAAVVYSTPVRSILPATQTVSGPQPATFVVNLPADAKLKVNGTPTTSTSSRRVFETPPLQPGQPYHYTLQAQVTRNGQTVTLRKEIPVQAGRLSEVTIAMPAASASASR